MSAGEDPAAPDGRTPGHAAAPGYAAAEAGEDAPRSGVLGGMSRGSKIVIVVSACFFAVVALILAIGSNGGSSQAASAKPAAKPFTLHALGHPGLVSLSQYAGRPVLVNFFASWCTPCQKETPLLARFYRAHHGKVAIIGVDVNDSATAATRFVKRAGTSYPVGADPTASTATRYGVVAIPQTFFLNAEHHIVKRVFGAVTLADLTSGLALTG